MLFEIDQRFDDPLELLREREAGVGDAVAPYTGALVRGVIERRERIDEIISTYSQGWTIDRMPAVDRQILRVGVFEVLYQEDVPGPVAIDQCVKLAKAMSTDDSPRFVHGLLARVVDMAPGLSLD